jgi:hypothetical protein
MKKFTFSGADYNTWQTNLLLILIAVSICIALKLFVPSINGMWMFGSFIGIFFISSPVLFNKFFTKVDIELDHEKIIISDVKRLGTWSSNFDEISKIHIIVNKGSYVLRFLTENGKTFQIRILRDLRIRQQYHELIEELKNKTKVKYKYFSYF